MSAGGREPLRLDQQQRVTLLSESDVSEAVVELRGLELDLAGEPRSASHGVEAGGLSSALRRFRSEAWRHQVGPKACAACSSGCAH